MSWFGSIPRRCVNLPPGSLRTLAVCFARQRVVSGPALEDFSRGFSEWLGVPHVFGTSSGRTAFQLALEALDLPQGAEIIFPSFTFPVMPMVAKILGYRPVFCDVDGETFNSSAEHFERRMTADTGAILATHLFGQPCPIQDITRLARERHIRVIEDCAHACGVRIGGRQVGTFGDIGVFSFAEGKNMPCCGGGAIATADDGVAARAREILAKARVPSSREVRRQAVSVWLKWLLTRPSIFGVTAYPVLRLKLLLGQSLMDSEVGDRLLEHFAQSRPTLTRMANLQAAIGLLQLKHIDRFNEGARRNAGILTEKLGVVPGIRVPRSMSGDHIYTYYPLTVDPQKRDHLRRHLLKHGIDTKTTDMSDCAALEHFRRQESPGILGAGPREASILEICVYPAISEDRLVHAANVIRSWAGLSTRG